MIDYFNPDKRWDIYDFKSQEDYAKKVVIKGYFHDRVPEAVVKAFTTAEYLMAHAYFHWEMFDEAFKKCLFTLEMAIKIKAEQEGIRTKRKKKNGQMWQRPLSKIVKDICAKDYLSTFKLYLDSARELRNTIAHPERHGFIGPNGSNRYIKHLVNVINTLFLDEESFKDEVRMVRKASKDLSRIARANQLFLMKGKSGIGYLIYELLDFDYFDDDLVLIIHPYPSVEMLEVNSFICSDPLKIVFKDVVFEKDSLSGIADDGDQLKLCQLDEKQFSTIKEAYQKHLKGLSEIDIIISLGHWNFTSSWKLVEEEYRYNKMRYS
jgi:hypothetical protein